MNLVNIFRKALKSTDAISLQSAKTVQRFHTIFKYGEVIINTEVLQRLENNEAARIRKNEDILQRKKNRLKRKKRIKKKLKKLLQFPETEELPTAKKVRMSIPESNDKKEIIVGQDFAEIKWNPAKLKIQISLLKSFMLKEANINKNVMNVNYIKVQLQ